MKTTKFLFQSPQIKSFNTVKCVWKLPLNCLQIYCKPGSLEYSFMSCTDVTDIYICVVLGLLRGSLFHKGERRLAFNESTKYESPFLRTIIYYLSLSDFIRYDENNR